MLDTRMHLQELRGDVRHRTQFQWLRVGRDRHGQRVVLIDGDYYFLGHSSGEDNNCFIHTLRQCLNIVVSVEAVRAALTKEFHAPCGPTCDDTGLGCTDTCMKVYSTNYLTTDHWEAVIRLLGKHCMTGELPLDPTEFCVRVLELTWQDNGVVLGNPAAPRRLTVARVHGNHFIPVLRFLTDMRNTVWQPW